MVYNLKDELIFTQTATQGVDKDWVFNKYDVLGRLIQTGVYASGRVDVAPGGYRPLRGPQFPSVGLTFEALQKIANEPYNGSDAFLRYMFTDIYGNAAYISSFSKATVYTTNYYDDYSFTNRRYNDGYMSSLQEGWNTTVSAETTNMLTGTKTLVLDGASKATELLSVNFYNDRGLLLQSQVQNHKGGWSTITNNYDFSGKKMGTYTEINNPAATDNATLKTVENFYYDHAGRLLADNHNLNDMGGQIAAGNNYDELGRLKNKNVSPNGIIPTVEYNYNVRGWLTGINKDYCDYPASSWKNFGMEISYDYGYNTNYLNGNIAGIKWRNCGKEKEFRSYGFTYDPYNRLKSGDFVMEEELNEQMYPWSNAKKDFSASNITYDENGNLTSMKQLGLNAAGQKIILDDLQYTYTNNSNKLLRVGESAASQSKDPNVYNSFGDFRDVAAATDYTYDANGSLLTDANKSLSFKYDDVLNKTKRVTKGSQNVDYLYDAAGNKLQKRVSGGTATVTDYIGNAVYINNGLSFMSLPEGRIRYDGTKVKPYMYDFFIKDHLGSTRAVITYTTSNITGRSTSAAPKVEPIVYLASSEPENAAKEDQLFDNTFCKTKQPNSNRQVCR